jgi:Cd(II)/Pb(II)-responsive transcriptional regulator
MKIGELARATETPVETIRYYERAGLLRSPARSAGNYRQYDEAHVERLAFIRHCRGLDMTLDEIRVLLRFKDAPEAECGEVNALLDEHIRHVADRIGELRALEKELKVLRVLCDRSQRAADCGILGGLGSSANVGHPRGTAHHAHPAGTHGRPERPKRGR